SAEGLAGALAAVLAAGLAEAFTGALAAGLATALVTGLAGVLVAGLAVDLVAGLAEALVTVFVTGLAAVLVAGLAAVLETALAAVLAGLAGFLAGMSILIQKKYTHPVSRAMCLSRRANKLGGRTFGVQSLRRLAGRALYVTVGRARRCCCRACKRPDYTRGTFFKSASRALSCLMLA
ncbi:MAG: hypothetical protein RL700_1729, partial [Pseudomonadota bacterium]